MITVLLLFIFSLILISSPKYAFLLFIFLYPLIPKYMNVEIPGLKIYLPHQTIMLLILMLFTFFIILGGQIKEKTWMLIKEKKLLLYLGVFFLIRISATLLLSIDKTGGMIAIIFYMLDSLVILSLASVYINNDLMLRKLLFTLFASYLTVLVIGYLEKYNGENLFLTFVDLRYGFYADMIAGNIRNEAYRLMGSFENTLLLTSYLSVMLALIVAIPKLFKEYKLRMFRYLIILFAIPLILWTYSRTGLLLLSIYFFVHLLVIFYNKISYRIKKYVRNFIYIFIGTSIVLLFLNIDSIINYMLESASGISEKASIESRYNQFTTTMDVVNNNILLGNGVSRNLVDSIDGLPTIDNYYLRLFIESGILGLGAFIIFLYKVFQIGVALLNLNLNRDDRLIIYSVLLSLGLMCLNLFFLSIPSHHIYLYLLVYLIIYYSNKYTNDTKKNKGCS